MFYNIIRKLSKCRKYYRIRENLLQSLTGMTKCGIYYKERERDVTRYYLKRKITKTLNYLHLSWIQSKNSINDLKISGQNYCLIYWQSNSNENFHSFFYFSYLSVYYFISNSWSCLVSLYIFFTFIWEIWM